MNKRNIINREEVSEISNDILETAMLTSHFGGNKSILARRTKKVVGFESEGSFEEGNL